MIWSSGIKEASHTSGGKGLGGGKQTTFTYSASFAFAFAAGPCARILRIWADSKLVYDETGDTLAVPGVVIRQYYGTETQLPDSAIVADKGADAPGFRGLVYIVAEQVPLAPFGNRIPNISAEIAFDGSSLNSVIFETFPVPWADTDFPTGFSSQLFSGYAWDFARNYFYRQAERDTTGIAVTDLTTMELIKAVSLDSLYDGTAFVAPASGSFSGQVVTVDSGNGTDLYALITSNNSLPTATDLVRISPETMRVTGVRSPALHLGVFGLTFGVNGCVNKAFTTVSSFTTFVAYNAGTKAFIYDGTLMTHVGNLPDTVNYTDGNNTRLIPGAQNDNGTCDFWFIQTGIGDGSSNIDAWRITLGGVPVAALAFTVDGATIVPGHTDYVVQRAEWDRANAAMLWWVAGDSGNATLVSVRTDGTINWSYATASGTSEDKGASLLDGTTIAFLDGSHVTMLDTRTGAVVLSVTLSPVEASFFGGAYNSRSESIFEWYLAVGFQQLKLNRGQAGVALLGDIVHDICVEAGLTDSDIDTTDLTDTVRGYTHVQEVARNLLGDLSGAYFFDGVESDYKIKFKKRGSAPLLTIPYGNVRPGNTQAAALPVQRNQAENLPRRVWVRYPDVDNNQQQGTQYFSRSQRPDLVSVVNSVGEATMDLRIVLTASEAKTLAMKRLLMMWTERETFPSIGLGPSYIALDPADVVNVTLRDGTIARVRLEKAAVGADLSLELAGTIEDATLLTVVAVGDGGTGISPTLIPTFYTPVAVQYEMPLIRDIDDTSGTALREYGAFGAFSGQTFGGASLYVSADTATWSALFTSTTSMKWGVAVNALPAPAAYFCTDNINHLDVSMAFGGGSLETATYSQVMEGANPAILITSSGDVEVIQYQTVTPLGGSLYRLTGLQRGRRGSEWVAGSHNSGDRFVLLDATTWRESTVPLAWLGLTRYEKTLGASDSFDSVLAVSRVFKGTAEKPYAPVFVDGTYDGSNNLVLTWIRRTRIGGEWLDGVEVVPLSEATESYSIDILSSGVVVRTLTVTSPTATYTAADQVTDGLDAAAKDIAVYQISATVGRGFAGTASIAAP